MQVIIPQYLPIRMTSQRKRSTFNRRFFVGKEQTLTMTSLFSKRSFFVQFVQLRY